VVSCLGVVDECDRARRLLTEQASLHQDGRVHSFYGRSRTRSLSRTFDVWLSWLTVAVRRVAHLHARGATRQVRRLNRANSDRVGGARAVRPTSSGVSGSSASAERSVSSSQAAIKTAQAWTTRWYSWSLIGTVSGGPTRDGATGWCWFSCRRRSGSPPGFGV
jgi:hypothetical protein